MSFLLNKLIFNKFQAKKLLFNSSISNLYVGLNKLTNESVAIKSEKIGGKYDLLESEAYFLLLLKGFGIPRLISFGKFSYFKILVEELLGPTIYLIWNYKNKKDKLKDICLIALQCLDRLEYIHSKGIIHKDIKPFNFLFGKKDPNIIYVIDFGISKKYRSSRTGKHIKYTNLKRINGSFRYMSINCNKGYEQSRRDDLESLGYMLIFLAKGDLPWPDIDNNSKENRIIQTKKICEKKIKISPEELCSGLPTEFSEYVKYCKKLEFEEEPNYNYIKNLFIEILKKKEQLLDEKFLRFIQFSWLKKKKSSNSIDNNKKSTSYSKYNDSKKRKESAHKRLYKQIKDSINIAKSQDVPKIMYSNFFKFNANNISITAKNMNIDEKKKSEIERLTNLSVIKPKNEINEGNNNNNKIDINKKHEIKSSFNELEKRKNIDNNKKIKIYNKKISNTQTVKNQDKNILKLNSEKTKGFHRIIIPKTITNVNKTDNYNNDSNSIEQLSLRYYKTLRERNEMKENTKDRKRRYISIFNNPILAVNSGSQEKNISHFNMNNFQHTNENNHIFYSNYISLRRNVDLPSFNSNHNKI